MRILRMLRRRALAGGAAQSCVHPELAARTQASTATLPRTWPSEHACGETTRSTSQHSTTQPSSAHPHAPAMREASARVDPQAHLSWSSIRNSPIAPHQSPAVHHNAHGPSHAPGWLGRALRPPLPHRLWACVATSSAPSTHATLARCTPRWTRFRLPDRTHHSMNDGHRCTLSQAVQRTAQSQGSRSNTPTVRAASRPPCWCCVLQPTQLPCPASGPRVHASPRAHWAQLCRPCLHPGRAIAVAARCVSAEVCVVTTSTLQI